ncbi:hypothetical protein BCV69DRAFT_12702 [Microstroma glucosiphilum]|uniref:Uncharacterized protein n=1 Tax=Pseudomicrostroma glucosiphilum TaxID=1684307 RepID=A0A316UF87_9BASI|nr:hypothetical protein BCV69DRAFT_12702 [Pseudomicrostroma glucosiphilum]PWN23870.1 hypothetical protein BCV69DRAFT_12702 [Pseudomicrostroma glucosiphilum]
MKERFIRLAVGIIKRHRITTNTRQSILSTLPIWLDVTRCIPWPPFKLFGRGGAARRGEAGRWPWLFTVEVPEFGLEPPSRRCHPRHHPYPLSSLILCPYRIHSFPLITVPTLLVSARVSPPPYPFIAAGRYPPFPRPVAKSPLSRPSIAAFLVPSQSYAIHLGPPPSSSALLPHRTVLAPLI